MKRREHQRQTEQQRQQGKPGNRHMHGENVCHRLLQIVVNPPPQADCRNDRCEIVVEQNEGRSLARDIGPAPFHGDADVAVLRAGASFTLSPVMATTSPLALTALTMRSFCSGIVRAKIAAERTRWASSVSLIYSRSLPVTTSPALRFALNAIAHAVCG